MKNFRRFSKNIWKAFRQTISVYGDIDPFNKSIVIAWYTIFSLPGLLVIIINIAGYFFGTEAVTGQITDQVGGIIGGDTAGEMEKMIANATQTKGTTLASILGAATLIFGATGVFYNLQLIFNQVWEVKPRPKGKILKIIKDRIFSFGLILVVGFLLLVSLVLSAALAAVANWVSSHISESLQIMFKALDILVSLGVITLLFAALFKFLPDAKVKWNSVWVGALLTSVLFVVAKFLLGLYFGKSEPGSTYGAAGSIILIMLWVSYASLILLFGGLFTRVYANVKGYVTPPTEGAQNSEPQIAGGTLTRSKQHGDGQNRRRVPSEPHTSSSYTKRK